MYGSLFSVLLLGLVPVSEKGIPAVIDALSVVPPAGVHADAFIGLQDALSATGAVIVDLDSAQTVFQKNADVMLPMASLTKLMTALVVVENHSLDEVVTIPSSVLQVDGNTAKLPVGEQFTVGDLLSALLIVSANDAAMVLAEYHSGSRQAFVDAMNERATELGLKETSFQNPAGFDAATQHSSARDLAWLAMYVLRNPAIAIRMSVPEQRITSVAGKHITLVHTHHLLHNEDALVVSTIPRYLTGTLAPPALSAERDHAFVIAGKTGTTNNAGQCLLSITEARGRRYIAVLMQSKDRYADMDAILASLNE